MIYSLRLRPPKLQKKGGFASLHFSSSVLFPAERQGMSLINLLVAIVVIATLAVLLFGGAKTIIKASQGVRCANNLKQLGAATRLYTAENNGYLPFYCSDIISAGRLSFTERGAWYWHIAPYLNVPRWESNKVNLGPQGGKIFRPNVFSCPSHGKSEIAAPLEFPTSVPVSYAPSTEISASMTPLSNQEDPDILVKGLRVQAIASPSQKIWLSDSTLSSGINTTASRWTSEDDKQAWARVPFQRHNEAGNVLFYDGHVERITYHSMVTGDITTNVRRLFRP